MRRRCLPGLIAALLFAIALQPSAQPPPGNTRTTVVISDLHMGAGRNPDGAWHPQEDFRWQEELAAFLEAIDRQGAGAVDLVLNGDTFELLEPVGVECGDRAPELGCTEAGSLARLDRVLAAHPDELRALARFARSGSNRVVLVPGDHDAALVWPAAAQRVVAALDAPAGRVAIEPAGWRSGDGRLYAEHGHQIGLSPHRFAEWPRPFVRRDGGEHLARSWGEQAVQDVYNRLEPRYPIADNFAASGAGVKYALSADGVADAGDAAAPLLRHLLFTLSWQQFRMELDDGEVEPPVWDLERVRAGGGALLVSAVPEDDPFKPLAAKALADGSLDGLPARLSDEELVALCDYRAAVRRARRRFEPAVSQFVPRGPIVTECPRTPGTRGARYEYFWRSRDRTFLQHLDAVAARLPGGRRPEVFVHGHTHLPDRAQSNANMISGGLLKIPMEGFSPVRFAVTPVAINGGAWQRTITPVQFERLKAERQLSTRDLLAALQPEELPPCYGFVIIPPYSGAPEPAVRYWRPEGAGWSAGTACAR